MAETMESSDEPAMLERRSTDVNPHLGGFYVVCVEASTGGASAAGSGEVFMILKRSPVSYVLLMVQFCVWATRTDVDVIFTWVLNQLMF